jgi:penicillin-insensitive murein endopeptidase
MVRLFTLLGITALCACATEPLSTGQTISVGTTDEGYIRDAVALKDRGEGYRRLRPGEDSRYGTQTLIEAIERAAREVARSFPGGHPLRVGDLSNPSGGIHARHRSHRAGRDADLLFYVRDPGGLAAAISGWLKFDQLGVGVWRDRVYQFDDARNWHLVRTLVLDQQARVKWLLCSNPLKARLLRYAAAHEPSTEAVLRATWVLHQPSHGEPHDDHFHLRVGCNAMERELGCREEPPHWPWLSDAARKENAKAGIATTDERLVGWLFAQEHVNQGRHVAWRGFDSTAKPSIVAGR